MAGRRSSDRLGSMRIAHRIGCTEAGAVTIFPFRVVGRMQRHTESPRTEMDLADASLPWLASDTGVTSIMDTDLRDFSRYRLADGRGFDTL